MRVLIVGANGMLGSEVVAHFKQRGYKVLCPSMEELDITDPLSVANVGSIPKLDWCINCSGYTLVDKAEDEPELTAAVNSIGPSYLARACAMSGVKFVHISTDFVFDGGKTIPYEETDVPHPLSVYARTKLGGEEGVLAAHPQAIVFRTSWLYGIHGTNFPATIVRAWNSGRQLKVVGDQTGNPTYAKELARVIGDSVERNLFPGIYHATGPDSMTWFDLANLAVNEFRRQNNITREADIARIRTEDWPVKAVRPRYSVLSNAKLIGAGIAPMKSTFESIPEFIAELEIEPT